MKRLDILVNRLARIREDLTLPQDQKAAKKDNKSEFDVALTTARTKLKEAEDKIEERFIKIEEFTYISRERITLDAKIRFLLKDALSAIENLEAILKTMKKYKVKC